MTSSTPETASAPADFPTSSDPVSHLLTSIPSMQSLVHTALRHTCWIAALSLGSPAALAQLPHPIAPQILHGPAGTLASGLSISADTRHAPSGPQSIPDHVFLRPPSLAFGAPYPWTATTTVAYGEVPYSLQAMFPNHWSTIEIDAHCTGRAMIPPITPQGGVDMSGYPWSERWFGLVVSVSNDSLGEPGSVFEMMRGGPSGTRALGSDLVSHYWEDSHGIAGALIGSTLLESSREDMGFPLDEDVDALDYTIGVNYFTPGLLSRFFFEETGQYLFSVSKEWARSAAAAGFLPAGALPDPAAIYRIQWLGPATGWSQPMVHKTRAELGLYPLSNPLGEFEDIDALAVGSPDRVIYSSKRAAGHNQVLVYWGVPLASPVSLKANDTTLASVALGLRDDDEMDGTCPIDPEPANTLGNTFGTPTEQLFGRVPGPWNGPPMGASTTLISSVDASNQLNGLALILELSGWGNSSPRSGSVDLYVNFGSPGNETAYSVVASYARNASQDVMEFPILLPPTFPSTAVGFAFAFRPAGFTLPEATSLTSRVQAP